MRLGLCARHVSGYYPKTQQLRTSLCGLVSAAANEVEVNQRHVAGWRHLQVGEVGDEAWSSALQRAQGLHANEHVFGTVDEIEEGEETQDDVRHLLGEGEADKASETADERGVSSHGTCAFLCWGRHCWSAV